MIRLLPTKEAIEPKIPERKGCTQVLKTWLETDSFEEGLDNSFFAVGLCLAFIGIDMIIILQISDWSVLN